ncbi:hypothetical protein GGI25_003443 [Coemansia spiralis]|uniref:Xylanolytic transcriptional activator regulatory domain-containing protein n=1 Tax=Coemansia spiralis TaxID=417178 RepID=A0A9W8KY33_9FUNG|nr:hypothetical protein GGI25_003443 [Coemansia spiralis]
MRSGVPGAGDAPLSSAGAAQPEKKKKRLTQACQHCRKRGRNGIRISMMPPFVGSGPYDRQMPSQNFAISGHGVPSMGSSVGGTNSSMLSMQQHGQITSQQQQSVLQLGNHGNSSIPPQLQMHQQQPPPPHSQSHLQINPLRPAYGNEGPVSLHLKRDPGFGQDLMEEGMYDPAKQAYEMSSHFILPMNNFHFPQFTPSNQMSYGWSAGPSNRNNRVGTSSSSQLGIPGSSSYPHRTQSGSSMGRNGLGDQLVAGTPAIPNATGFSKPIGGPANKLSQTFDPTVIAQSLSSIYASAIAGMPVQNNSADVPGVTNPTKLSNAPGKSTSQTPLELDDNGGHLSQMTTRKMCDLRNTIREIISSVWADTECGRSAGMAGVTMADDELGNSDEGIGSYSYKSKDGNKTISSALNTDSGDNESIMDTLLPGMHRSSIATGGNAQAAMSDDGEIATNSKIAQSGCGDRLMDDHLISIFFDNVYHQLPIIHRKEFYGIYNKGEASSLLICAMCAAASVFLNRIEDERKAIYEQYSRKVREQFHDACFEPSLEVVQTALIMTLCEYRHGSLHRAWVYLSMGFRLAIAMGYHHLDNKVRAGPAQSTTDIVRREACRRAFWGAFLLDRYTAIGGGKALGINDNDISVLLPLREEDWEGTAKPPPLSTLEFFKPTSLRPLRVNSVFSDTISSAAASDKQVDDAFVHDGRRNSTDFAAMLQSPAAMSNTSSPLTGNIAASRHGTPTSTSGWDNRASDASALSSFVKLMAVIGQVAQHINSSKVSPGSGDSNSSDKATKGSDRPSKDYAALDAALLRWKEELSPSLSYSEATSADTDPELSVFISCMHAIYYGAVIMLNRENMGLLRDLPGQLDVSSNLAIRSLERCRVAAMQVVEISHHICSLPTAMTNALLPWALFQAGTLLIHFMIAGSTSQAQEEARSAILSLDCALRDELSRYWNVSSKYHLVLSNMVKAWERTRQSTPSMTPLQKTNSSNQQHQHMLQAQQAAQGGSTGFARPANNVYQGSGTQAALPLQMQLYMQLPTQYTCTQQQNVDADQRANQQQQQQGTASTKQFQTLMKPYSAPNSEMLNPPSMQPDALFMEEAKKQQQQQQNASSLMSNFMFTADTAQDSINTFNEFLAQLSQEQTRHIAEGLQAYSLQTSRGQGAFAGTSMNMADSSSIAGTSRISGGFGQMMSQMTPQQATLLTNAALQCMQSSGSSASSFDLIGNSHQDRLQDRRGSLPISSSSDLFTAPGAASMLQAGNMPQASNTVSNGIATPSASAFAQIGQDNMMSTDMLDPLLFNSMTPFLQELQLFHDPSLHQHSRHQQQQSQQQQTQNVVAATGSSASSIASSALNNSNVRPQG